MDIQGIDQRLPPHRTTTGPERRILTSRDLVGVVMTKIHVLRKEVLLGGIGVVGAGQTDEALLHRKRFAYPLDDVGMGNTVGVDEKYDVRLAARGPLVANFGWTGAATAALDQYNLRAVFGVDLTGDSAFAANDDLTGTAQAASATVFAEDAAGAGDKGFDVLDTSPSERTLWFRLAMPTSMTAVPSDPFTTVWISAIAG